MTVRITKPEFNLREKLSELDYSTLPYDKIPPGGIVQCKTIYAPNTTFTTTAQDWTTIDHSSANYEIKITPKFLGSLITYEVIFTANLNDDDGYVRYRLVDFNNPSGTTVFHANTYCGASHYKTSTDDWIAYPIRAMGTVTHMNEHNLVLQARVKQGGTLSFSWSGSDYRVVRVTEIRQ